jgi:copper chaperone CopZ
MRYKLFLILILPSLAFAAGDMQGEHASHGAHQGHTGHADHIPTEYVDGTQAELDDERFKKFVSDLSGNQIAVVSVSGMVCDFCARGIEKTFQKDAGFKKIDVDLETGKVLLAFAEDKQIVNEDIEQKILANGQTVTAIQIMRAQ